ncbi:MAG: GAF domain-containing protein [Actinobacteria bacterium]|nr:GAF domain-containing protein [Actinomycetota bacterium]
MVEAVARGEEKPHLSLADARSEESAQIHEIPDSTVTPDTEFLSALLQINDLLISEHDLHTILAAILRTARELLKAESGSLLVVDHDSGDLIVGASTDFPPEVGRGLRIPIGTGIAGWVAEKRKPLLLVSGREPPGEGDEPIHRSDVRDGLSVPLERAGELCGVLNLTNQRGGDGFTRADLDLLTAFGKQAAIAIYQARIKEDRKRGYLGLVSSLVRAVDARDPYTFGHSRSVRDYAVALALFAGMPDHDLVEFANRALLHDIGKIGVRDAILLKPGRLTDAEFEVIKTHPVLGADILRPVMRHEEVLAAVRHHHERYDGHGYPDGLAGNDIPLAARILAIADAYDAMSSTRNYRIALTPQHVLAELRDNRGRQFDPELVHLFLDHFRVEAGPLVTRQQALALAGGVIAPSDYEGYAGFSMFAGREEEPARALAELVLELAQAQLDTARLYTSPRRHKELTACLNAHADAQGIPITVDSAGAVRVEPAAGANPIALIKALQTYEICLKTKLLACGGLSLADRVVRESLQRVSDRARTLHAQIFV